MIDADIQVIAGGWRSLKGIPEDVALRAVRAIGASRVHETGACQVSIALSDDAHVRALNREHRGKDRPTNVLAFPAAPGGAPPDAAPRFLGDIILAFETVEREAQAQTKPFADHMSHLIVHGALHLLGYDHGNERDAIRMEAEEAAILDRLGIPDPYQTDPAKEAGTADHG